MNELVQAIQNTIDSREVSEMMEVEHSEILKKLEGSKRADKSVKQAGIIPIMTRGEIPVSDYLSAISVGIVDNQILLDLEYEEDSRAEVDMNFVMTGSGLFIELQGTAERVPFNKAQLDQMTELAVSGIQKIIERQKEIVGDLRA